MARLASGFWVGAYLARLRLHDIPAYVLAHGDDDAGAILVKVARLDGTARVRQRVQTLEGRRWDVLAEGDESEVDAAIARQRGFDSDLWVIELEDRQGRDLLEEEGLDG